MEKIIIFESNLVEFFCKPTKFLFPSKKVVSTKVSVFATPNSAFATPNISATQVKYNLTKHNLT